ncbi:MAG: tetratricopeptide repeat protein [bacterium]
MKRVLNKLLICLLLCVLFIPLSYAEEVSLEVGEAYFQAKAYKKAIDVFLKVLKKGGYGDKYAKASLRLGQCYLAIGDLKEARKYLEIASNTEGNVKLESLIGISVCDIEEGKLETAIDSLSNLISLNPERKILAYAYYNRGIAYEKKGWVAKAVNDFQEAITRSDDRALLASAKSHLSSCQFTLNQFQEEEKTFLQRINQSVNASSKRDLYHELAKRCADVGEIEKAISYEMKSLDYSKDENYNAGALMNIAWRYALKGDYESSAIYFQKVANDYPASTYAQEALLRAGDMFSKAKKIEEAIAIYQEFLNRYPSDLRVPNVLLNLAWRYYEKGFYEKAGEYFLKAASSSSKLEQIADALLRAGDMYSKAGKTMEAEKIYKGFLQRFSNEPNFPSALMNLAWVYANTKDYEKAAQLFKMVADNFPQNDLAPEALLRAGDMFSKAKKLEQAIKTYKEFIEKYPNDNRVPSALLNIAWTFFSEKNYVEASKWFKEVVDNYPDSRESREALFRLGDAYSLQGKNEEAIEVYKTFIDKYPSDELAPFALMNIAWRYRWMRDWEKEKEVLQTLHETLPEGELKWFALGLLYEDSKQYEKAIEAYEKAIKYDGDFRLLSLIGIADCGYKVGAFEKGLDAVIKVLIHYDVYSEYAQGHYVALSEIFNLMPIYYIGLGYNEEQIRSATISALRERKERFKGTISGADASLALMNIDMLTEPVDKVLKEYDHLIQDYKSISPEVIAIALGDVMEYLKLKGEGKRALVEYEKLKKELSLFPPETLLRIVHILKDVGEKQEMLALAKQILDSNPNTDVYEQTLMTMGKYFYFNGDKRRAVEEFKRIRENFPETFASATSNFWLTLLENSSL